MFLLTLLITFVHVASGNDLELFLYDIDFRMYRIMAKASDNSFIEAMSFLDGDFTPVKYDDDSQSILNAMSEYNKTADYANKGLNMFISFCPDLIQTGFLCSSSLKEMQFYYDIAVDIVTELEGESKEDGKLKIQEMYDDMFDVEITCYERNASSFILSNMVTEAWYFIDGLEDEVYKMHVKIKQHEDVLHRESGMHNYTSSLKSQDLIADIKNATASVNSLRYAIQFCQRRILNYTLINSTVDS